MIEAILNHLENVKQTGPDRWVARCPAHDDKSPSLSVAETSDGKVLLNCFAGCAAQEIVGAFGLELKDLFPESSLTLLDVENSSDYTNYVVGRMNETSRTINFNKVTGFMSNSPIYTNSARTVRRKLARLYGKKYGK